MQSTDYQAMSGSNAMCVVTVLLEMHDPNAIDTLRFSVSLAFAWPAIAKPRQRRRPVR
jgi:hypothetical protein